MVFTAHVTGWICYNSRWYPSFFRGNIIVYLSASYNRCVLVICCLVWSHLLIIISRRLIYIRIIITAISGADEALKRLSYSFNGILFALIMTFKSSTFIFSHVDLKSWTKQLCSWNNAHNSTIIFSVWSLFIFIFVLLVH